MMSTPREVEQLVINSIIELLLVELKLIIDLFSEDTSNKR